MSFWDSITGFMAENVNLVMILLGFFVLGALFLLMYLDKKRNTAYDLKRQQEKRKQQEQFENQLFSETCSSINIDADDLSEKDKEILNDFFSAEEDVKGKVVGEKTIAEESNSKDNIQESKDNEDNDLLNTYENVIKESDAMLEAMQNIIEENIVEMENLEKQNVESADDVCHKDKVNIVSKYKVLYDKVKKEWVVKKEGSTRATKRCKTKEEAIDFAKKCTIDSELGLTFHKKDGKFQKKAKKD